MTRAKVPLAERDANATPKKSPIGKKPTKAASKARDPSKPWKQSDLDEINKIALSSKKRSRDDVVTADDTSPKASKAAKTSNKKQTGNSTPAKETKPSTSSSSSSSTKKNTKAKDSKAKTDPDKFNVSDMTLPDEASGKVPIFDTCDDVRSKLNAHLRQQNTTLASLGRTISQTYKIADPDADKPRTISGTQITTFLQKKGPRAGATSAVYYAAYVYFEKLRLKQGKDKSKKRVEMEEVHPSTGCRTDSDASTKFIGRAPPSEDKYGVLTFH